MSSTFANPERRSPRQARATLRREKFLEVAATLFGELGYDPVTMTAIAERAGASIGTLYDYFPDKQAVALALQARYSAESDEHWKTLLGDVAGLTKAELAELFVDGALALTRERPAYLALFGVWHPRSAADRLPLRRTIAAALSRVNPAMTGERAFLGAQVMVELIKGMLSVYKQTADGERERVVEEFKRLMRLYLVDGM